MDRRTSIIFTILIVVLIPAVIFVFNQVRDLAKNPENTGFQPSPTAATSPVAPKNSPKSQSSKRVSVVFSGGHETNPVDRGRPVILIAGALGVTPEVFRDAFSRVKPAPQGTRPTREREQMNNSVLMKALAPYGITNDRLDTVSNYYRYNPGRGEMWPTKPATAYANVTNGSVTRFEMIDGGSGYTSPPIVTVPGVASFNATVKLSFSSDFKTNGSISQITINR